MHKPTALITGATSGIGASAARRLRAAGFCVAITGRREDRLRALAAELDASGNHVLALPGDVTDAAIRRNWIETVNVRFGGLDALVNNAGYGQRGSIEETPLAAMRANFETNVFAPLGLIQEALPLLRASARGGRIVNVSSVAGRIARPLTSTYDATKHALEAFTDGLRAELHGQGIRVISVMPGFILTEFGDSARKVSEREIIALEAGRYGDLSRRARAGEGKAKRMAVGPDAVARCIEHALTSDRPSHRYIVPGHAKLFLLLRRLLPESLLMRILPR